MPRRSRGTLVDPKDVLVNLEGPSRERLARMALAAGTNKSALAQWLIDSIDVDEAGVPVGWREAHPAHEEAALFADTA